MTSTLADCASAALAALPDGFTLPVNTPPQIMTAIFWAVGHLGTLYHFGGSCTDPHSGDPDRQCDCSSLMQKAYRAAAVTIPRVTTHQVHAGRDVDDPAQQLPGDLILIPGTEGTMDNPRHVFGARVEVALALSLRLPTRGLGVSDLLVRDAEALHRALTGSDPEVKVALSRQTAELMSELIDARTRGRRLS